MSLELNWSCSGSVSGEMVNVVNPRASTSADAVNGPAWNLWWMKERMKEVGWTVVSSSDSQSTSSSDLWGSTFDATLRSSKNSKIFYNSSGGAHSWMVLQAPSGSASEYYFIIDYVSSDAASNKAQFTVSKGPIGGGSTTTRATGSADFGINSNTNSGATTLIIFDDYSNTTAQHRVNFHYTTNGAFIFSEVQVGKGKFTGFLSFLPLQNTHAVDQYKWVLVGLDIFNNASGYSAFANYGLTGQALYTEGSNAISGRSHDGGVALNLAGAVLAIAPEGGAFNSNGIVFSGVLTAPNASDSTYSDFPITVVNAVNGPSELKGRLPDITWTSVSIPNGAVAPVKSVAADAYERTKYLMMWLPWTSVDAPIL
jgi:hypothetical protein